MQAMTITPLIRREKLLMLMFPNQFVSEVALLGRARLALRFLAQEFTLISLIHHVAAGIACSVQIKRQILAST